MVIKYGNCLKCCSELEPIWCTEDEYTVDSKGILTWTGRERKSCSHLECPSCLKKYCVDDTFNGEWVKKK